MKNNFKKTVHKTCFLLCCFFIFNNVHAESVEELNKQIDSYEQRIKEIDKEIEEQRKLIQTTSAKAGESKNLFC